MSWIQNGSGIAMFSVSSNDDDDDDDDDSNNMM